MSNVLNYRSGQNVCSSSCPIEHIDIPGDKIKKPSKSWPDIRGLNSLNYSREKWLTGDAIEVSIEEYCRGLPQALQDKIGLGIPGLRPDAWCRGSKGAEAMNMAIAVPQKRALARLSRTEYSLFPVCVNHNHWVLVFMRKAARNGEKEFLHVTHIAVIDPEHSSTTVRLVYQRLHQWLTVGGNFTFSPYSPRVVWAPVQRDGTSCGPRAYWNAKQLLDRLLELHEEAIYEEALWNDLSGWFNEDFVRSEITGRCAWAAVRGMDYNARVAVECVNRVRRYDASNAPWERADQLMKAIDIKNKKPERRPNLPPVVSDNGPGGMVRQLTPMQISTNTTPFSSPARDTLQGQIRDATPVRSNAGTPAPSSQGGWKPSSRGLNRHKVMPNLKAGPKELVVVNDSADEREEALRTGPAFSKSLRGTPVDMGTTKANPIYIADSPSSRGSPGSTKSRASSNDSAKSSGVAFFSQPPSRGETPVRQLYGLNTPVTDQINPKDKYFSKGSLSDPFAVAAASKTAVPLDTPVSLPQSKRAKTTRHLDPIVKNLFPQRPGSSLRFPVTFPSPPELKQRPKTPFISRDSSRQSSVAASRGPGSSRQSPIVIDSPPRPGSSRQSAIVLDDSPDSSPAMAALATRSPSVASDTLSKRKRDEDDSEVLFVWGPLRDQVEEVRKVKKAKVELPKGYKAVSFLDL